MGICIDNKLCLKENLTYLLPSVRVKLLITVCLEIPCMIPGAIRKLRKLKIKVPSSQNFQLNFLFYFRLHSHKRRHQSEEGLAKIDICRRGGGGLGENECL